MQHEPAADAAAPAASSSAVTAPPQATIGPATQIAANSNRISVWFRRLDVPGAGWSQVSPVVFAAGCHTVDSLRAALVDEERMNIDASLVQVMAAAGRGPEAPMEAPMEAHASPLQSTLPLLDALARVGLHPDDMTGRVWLFLKVASISPSSHPQAEHGDRPAKRARMDASEEYARLLVRNAPTVEWMETPDDLREELHAPLPGVIRVSRDLAGAILSAGVAGMELAIDRADPMTDISHLLYCAATEIIDEGSPNVWGRLADRLTGTVWVRLDRLTGGALGMRSNRYAASDSGMGDQARRPTYWICSRGALVCKAEHRLNPLDLGLARSDLVSSGWNSVALRGLPFLPCYVCAAEFLQFVAVVPPASPDAKCQVHAVSRVYNLHLPYDRIDVMRLSLNLFRVFVTLRNMMPRAVPTLYHKQDRLYGGSDIVMDDHVRKVRLLKDDADVYALLSGPSQLPCAVTVRVVARLPVDDDVPAGFTELHVTPVCSLEPPLTESDVKVAVVATLRALAALHGHGFVHRDVRWPNILRSAAGDWLLADFELAARVGTALPSQLRSSGSSCFAPEARHGEPYNQAQDMWQVGQLLSSWRVAAHSWLGGAEPPALSSAALELGTWLCDADPARRPSAQQALASDWFLK